MAGAVDADAVGANCPTSSVEHRPRLVGIERELGGVRIEQRRDWRNHTVGNGGLTGQDAVDQVAAIEREGDGLADVLVGQDRVGQVEVDVLNRRACSDVSLDARNGVDRVDIGHVECLGADRLNVACLQLREQRLLGGLEAADDDVVDGWLAAEVIGTRMKDHLHARIPAIEGVRAGAHRRSAEDAGLQILHLGRVLRVEVDQRRHALGRIDHHVRQALVVVRVDHRARLTGLPRGLGLVLTHHLEDDGVRVLGDHVRVLGLEVVARRGAPDRVERQLPAEDDVVRGQRRAVTELGVLPQMERRFKVLVRAVADHDCIAVVQGGDVDR